MTKLMLAEVTDDQLLLETSLYVPVAIEQTDRSRLEALRGRRVQIDAHCTKCGYQSIFKTMRSYGGGSPADPDWMFKDTDFAVQIFCQRCNNDYKYYFLKNDKSIIKTGQFPSIEDIASADIEKYRKILRKEDFSELRRAAGLFSHGIGIGAFVYLRRIFERLIYLHHKELEDTGSAIPDFGKLRMDEKVAALAAVLPPALVKSKRAYAILSKGLHELDEETCRTFFPVVKAAIVQILDQDLQARLAAENEKVLQAELAKIDGLLSNGGSQPVVE